jgi:hypothetical protein
MGYPSMARVLAAPFWETPLMACDTDALQFEIGGYIHKTPTHQR